MTTSKPDTFSFVASDLGATVPSVARLLRQPPTAHAPLSGRMWAHRFQRILQLSDAVVVISATSLAAMLQATLGPIWLGQLGTSQQDIVVNVLIATTWILLLSAFHTRDTRTIGVGSTEYRRVSVASFTTFGILAAAFVVLDIPSVRSFFLFSLPLGLGALLLTRWLWRRWLLRQRHNGHYLARAIVVGSRNDVEYVIEQIHANSGAAYGVVGVALDDQATGALVVGGRPVPVLSNLYGAAEVARRLGTESVIVAGNPDAGADYIRDLAWRLEGSDAELVLSSRLTDVAGPRIHFRPVDGLPLIHVEIPHFEGARHACKRGFDALAAGLGLLLIAPILAVIAVLIKIDSPGPVFFSQVRCGRNGENFRMLKFRSMVTDAEKRLEALKQLDEGNGVMFKLRDDPRITPLGRFLRAHSLDELPQLWNVLRGDMSLVGPRPPLPSEVTGYESHVHRRLYIKPGLTGLWQVNGRSNLSWEESVRLDLYYVENWSLTGDLVLIWRTIKTVVRPDGAY